MRTPACAVFVLLLLLVSRSHGAEPAIVEINQQYELNRSAMKTGMFKFPVARYQVWRRAATASIHVDLSADFDEKKHEVAIEVSHTFDPGAPFSLMLSPSAQAPAAGEWGLQTKGSGLRNGKKFVDLEIQIAKNAPIGEYGLKVVLRDIATKTAIQAKAFAAPTVILFNYRSKDDLVYVPEEGMTKAGREAFIEEYIANPLGNYRTEKVSDYREWRYGQFDLETLPALLLMMRKLDPLIPEKTMTSTERADPIAFSRALAQSINKYAQGDWEKESFGQGETSPRDWKNSNSLFAKFNRPPVKYARCWVFANMLTSLFRCAGIPARSVSCLKSAHNVNPADGQLDIYLKLVKGDLVIDTAKTKDTAWGFHAWTEVWMARPDRVKCDGWQVVDGTYGIGPAPVAAIAANSGGDFDVKFVYDEVNTPIQSYIDGVAQKKDTKSIGKFLYTKKYKSLENDNIVANYKPQGNRSDDPGVSGVTWDIPESVPIGSDITISAQLSNPTGQPVEVLLTVAAYAESYDQSPRGEVKPPESRTITLAPNSSETQEFEIPWQWYASLASTSDHVRIDACATNASHDVDWSAIAYVVHDLPPLTIARSSLDRIAPGETVGCIISFSNPFTEALTGCRIEIAALGALDGTGSPDGSVEVIELGSVSPGASFSWNRSYLASGVGDGTVSVQLFCDQQTPWNTMTSVVATACLFDFTLDEWVDDEDFMLFAMAYDALIVPPADPACDFTRDGVVDDSDFAIFISGYDGLACPAAYALDEAF